MRVNARRLILTASATLCSLGLAMPLSAATVVDVETLVGTITIELFEDQAPATASRFLENVNAGVYNATMMHHAQGGMLRGGLFQYNSCSQGPVEAAPGVRHALESTGLDNSFGTVALRRDPQNSNQISNEWQFNLANGVADQDAGVEPVVFGRIISGMDVADFIHTQNRIMMHGALPDVATFNYPFTAYSCSAFDRDNVVFVFMSSREVVNVYDAQSDQISLQVDAGEAGYLSLSFEIASTAPNGVIRALADSVTILDSAVAGMATFDAETGELTIPEFAMGNEVAFTNVVFTLTDSENLLFTLQSFDE